MKNKLDYNKIKIKPVYMRLLKLINEYETGLIISNPSTPLKQLNIKQIEELYQYVLLNNPMNIFVNEDQEGQYYFIEGRDIIHALSNKNSYRKFFYINLHNLQVEHIPDIDVKLKELNTPSYMYLKFEDLFSYNALFIAEELDKKAELVTDRFEATNIASVSNYIETLTNSFLDFGIDVNYITGNNEAILDYINNIKTYWSKGFNNANV